MSLLESVGVLLALALAFNIGGNNAGVAMGVPVGARLISGFWAALLAVAFELAGAALLGHRVTETVGGVAAGPPVHFLITVPLAGLAVILTANILRVPIPTTHAVVAALMGVGLAYRALHTEAVWTVLAWWAATPLVSAAVAFLLWMPFVTRRPTRARRFSWLLLAGGAFIAFSAGANNAANAAGPLVAAGVGTPATATLAAAAAMSLGSLVLGPLIMRTVGDGFTLLDAGRASVVAFTAGSVVLAASFSGVPVSLAEAVTGALIGVTLARFGARRTWRNRNVRRVAVAWTAGPSLAAGVSFLVARVAL